jgi:ABC-type branched-subunit amino acid transport system substrate-binding protein
MFRMLFEGLRRAGDVVTPMTVNKAIEGIRNLKVATGDISFSPSNHHPGRFIEITIVGPRGSFIR